VLFALGIRHVGAKAAETIAQGLHSMQALMDAPADQIAALVGIGPTIAASTPEGPQHRTTRDAAPRLAAPGLHAVPDDGAKEGSGDGLPFSGQTFLLTGALNTLTRGQAEHAIQSLGGKIAANVSKSLSHLIVGAAPGSKLERAEKLRVAVHDE